MEGKRTSKTVGGVTHNYVTQNGKVIQESYGTTVMQFIYDTNGNPFALRYTPDSGTTWSTYYYMLNAQGDVVAVTSGGLSVVASYTYDAWGRLVTSSGWMASINPLRYRGYYYDTETGFHYVQSRYYDPIVKRFINADSFASTGQGFLGYNMFAYCHNNPVNMIDITGHLVGTIASEWAATMWWLNGVDGLLPVGDIMYWGGLGILTIGSIIFVDHAATTYSNASKSKPVPSSKQNPKAKNKYVSNYGSTTAPPPGPNRPQNDRINNCNKNESPQWKRLDSVRNSRQKLLGTVKISGFMIGIILTTT